jgi:hypothetical protein
MNLICSILGHNVVQTGRRGFFLSEWRCLRCQRRFISRRQRRFISHWRHENQGFLLPRAKYEGLTFTVFEADAQSDRILETEAKIRKNINPP